MRLMQVPRVDGNIAVRFWRVGVGYCRSRKRAEGWVALYSRARLFTDCNEKHSVISLRIWRLAICVIVKVHNEWCICWPKDRRV